MEELKTVIGLEMHCELKSNAKVFSHGKNDYSSVPNSNVSPVDMAFPGILPTINKYNVEEALEMAKILNCEITDYIVFDRKNYYYPDLPKGYQITQCHKPMGVNGKIKILINEQEKEVLIHDIHLEEDAASLDHFVDTSTIDYNRAGVPLIEIVTEPCFYSADEAVAFLEEMRNIYQYTGISNADTKKGEIRCDVNVNLKNSKGEYVTPRVEVKNVNGFTNVRDTINYEDQRQRKAYFEHTEILEQETRRFDEDKGITIRMRTKVDAIDYKYFIEPNIPPYKVNKEWLDEIFKRIPELPLERYNKYINEYNLDSYDAKIIIKNKDISDYYEECLKLEINPKLASNWLTTIIVGILNKEEINIKDFFITPIYLKQIIDALNENKISSKQAKEIFNKAIEEQKEPNEYLKENSQISDKNELNKIIVELINNHPKEKEAYLNGKTNIFDFFVGQVMKETKGKANPNITKEILKEKLQ